MQISNSAYKGVEALLRLSVRNADTPCSTKSVAEQIDRSVSYTESLMAQLRNAGFVVSQRGPGGGYVLARPADRIIVAEVFRAVEAPSVFANRPHNSDPFQYEVIYDHHGTDLLWGALRNYVHSFLTSVSLADLAPEMDNLSGDSTNDSEPGYSVDLEST